MKRILTLTDFSDLADQAIEIAFELAKKELGEVIILHQLEEDELFSIPMDQSVPIDFIESENEKKQSIIKKWRQKSQELGVKCTLILNSESLISSIKSVTEKLNIDFIVMSSVSEYERGDYHYFSNAQSVIKAVNCPVLVIKKRIASANFRKIVFASSFNQKDQEVFKYFLQLLDFPKDTCIHLLAIDLPNAFSQPNVVMNEAMNDFAKIASAYEVKTHFYKDISVDSGIRHFIQETNPDLLVMGNKFNKPLSHFLRGNHVLWNVARADCPILTIDYEN
ncbi:universal stress protein [Saprospiraceae bacterium]|nr:universal stress protein [Saprospiraceae bacterium]